MDSPPPLSPLLLCSGDIPSVEKTSGAISDLRLGQEDMHVLKTAKDSPPDMLPVDLLVEGAPSIEKLTDAVKTLPLPPYAAFDDLLAKNAKEFKLINSAAPKSDMSNSPISLPNNNAAFQDLLVSLAANQTIWYALSKNEPVTDFSKGKHSEAAESNSQGAGSSANGVMKLMQAIKLGFFVMAQNLSQLPKFIFPNAKESSSGNKNNNFPKGDSPAAAIVLLTFATIMMVILKRA